MPTTRPQSRKLRALQAALQKSAAEIAAAYAPQPLSYAEIAAEWQEKVGKCFPSLGLQFRANDVYLLFRAQGVKRTGLAELAAEAVA